MDLGKGRGGVKREGYFPMEIQDKRLISEEECYTLERYSVH